MAWVAAAQQRFLPRQVALSGASPGQAGHWEARIGTFGDRKNVGTPAHPIYQRPGLRCEGKC